MSLQIDLYTAEPITEGEFLSWIGKSERLSVDEPSLEVMGRGGNDGLFWIYGAREGLRGDFESPHADGHIAELDEKLGGPPRVGLCLHLSSAPGSAQAALECASAFAARWPCVLRCLAYDVISLDRFDALVRRERSTTLFASEVLLALDERPRIAEAIEAFGGLTIGPADQPEAIKLAKLERDFDPERETMEGFFQDGTNDVWVVSERHSESCEDCGGSFLASRLEHRPRALVRVVKGWGPSESNQAAALSFARTLLEQCGGLLAGTFELILDRNEIQTWAAAGYGWRFR